MFKRIFITTILSAALVVPSALSASIGDKSTAIKVAVNNWTGQTLSAHILGQLIEKLGYDVEYPNAQTIPQYTSIGLGDLHVNPEIWENNAPVLLEKLTGEGKIVNVGPEGLSAREGWIYPTYMEEKCPGLPSWEALYDCAQAFGTAETFPNGRLITYPADWGTRSKDLVEYIKLPFEAVAGGTEGAMMAELKSAYSAKEPMLIMFWEPHWIHSEFDLKWVDWPKDEAVCEKKFGTPPDIADKCGFHQAGVYKIVWSGFKDKWPAAYALIEKFSLTNADQNPLINEVDNNGRKVEEVAADWVDQNEAVWKPWVKAAKS